MWDGVIETRDFVKHTIQNARFRKTHTKPLLLQGLCYTHEFGIGQENSYDFMCLTRYVILYVRGILTLENGIYIVSVFCCPKRRSVWEQKQDKLTRHKEE